MCSAASRIITERLSLGHIGVKVRVRVRARVRVRVRVMVMVMVRVRGRAMIRDRITGGLGLGLVLGECSQNAYNAEHNLICGVPPEHVLCSLSCRLI